MAPPRTPCSTQLLPSAINAARHPCVLEEIQATRRIAQHAPDRHVICRPVCIRESAHVLGIPDYIPDMGIRKSQLLDRDLAI
jgi:hypothetical protein